MDTLIDLFDNLDVSNTNPNPNPKSNLKIQIEKTQIDQLNYEQRIIFNDIITNNHKYIFITGGAGTGTISDTNSYIRVVKVKNVGGTLTLGTTSSSYTNEDITPFNATFVISGTNVIVQVLGAVNDNVTWTVSSVITQ